MIVFGAADIESALNGVIAGNFGATGQVAWLARVILSSPVSAKISLRSWLHAHQNGMDQYFFGTNRQSVCDESESRNYTRIQINFIP